ncbi:CpsB/CapC family capsule biosynthesis tyrosine phosphatase [uncultured Tenacibaculum sp.]|uniref:tyrosine-protein phosphatase n=1 Tax=uncultured Tenacibaculum sp. TaxID=174713 RepID=UPI0026036FB8|nr:CpsB/CapC family capsule biosynthesis tyrosine phosphatase [uncultured Tenacibaculum sp.]
MLEFGYTIGEKISNVFVEIKVELLIKYFNFTLDLNEIMFFLKEKKIPLTSFFDSSFIDIHSHLLPGIDDGAKNIEDSISLITKMKSYGIENFITTPHILGDVYPNTPELIKEKLNEVNNALAEKGIDVKIQAAAEYMMDEKFSQLLSEGNILILRDNFILVEMSYFNAPYNLYDILFEIQLKGYKPVLAHPERYAFYHKDFQNFYKLKKAGCLFQLNLLSLTEQYGKGVQSTAEKLIKEGLYDFVGTDTHHHNHLKLLEKIGTKKNYKKIETLIKSNSKFLME